MADELATHEPVDWVSHRPTTVEHTPGASRVRGPASACQKKIRFEAVGTELAMIREARVEYLKEEKKPGSGSV